MITPTKKQRLAIFSAYHRQVAVDGYKDIVKISSINYMGEWLNVGDYYNNMPVSRCSILLRTVEQMTDAELIEVSKICHHYEADMGRDILYSLKGNFKMPGRTLDEIVSIREYLISIGIAVQMHGMTVQDMVDNRIITIKNEKQ